MVWKDETLPSQNKFLTMTSNEIQNADMLDILFNNRNKQYGAYTLRKYYNNRLLVSLVTGIGGIFLLFFLLRPGTTADKLKPVIPEVMVRQFAVPPKIKIKEPQQRRSAPAVRRQATEKLTKFKLVERSREVVAEVRNFQNAAVGVESIEGRFRPDVIQPVERIQGAGNNLSTTPISALPSFDPEFPGGIAAWVRFLQTNLRMPDELQAGESRSVLMRFEVAVDGTVTGFEVVQSAGFVFDQEVIRVMKKMPRWKPAVHEGVAVARQFTQPVTFMATE